VLTYKEDPSKHLIDIGLSMGCVYILEYQGLIEQFVSSYVVLLSLSGWVLWITSRRSWGQVLGIYVSMNIVGLTSCPCHVKLPKLQPASLPWVPSLEW
jgi:hypothetical protein